ncbi:glycoside hydrolase family 18 protein [Hygrophoropsis aurantiaca]|uniref:Glycoside hydrolase family 18 protein n=1 Tax=Hygrophoropsis aurantiaca TaxID=72124 RepID=A0ACB7ZVW3_9AGAM|nr:glycoside hydrolase family 18 protein [Hygrophoropsis aurantiaca]
MLGLLFSALPLLALSGTVTAGVLHSPRAADAFVAGAWYTNWNANQGFPLSKVSWKKYNTLYYSFVVTTPSVHELSLDGSDPKLLIQFVSEAKKNGVSPQIAIGGWDGSRWFSSNVNSAENRTAFVKTVVDFAEKYQVDGINWDWEAPNDQGIGSNTISPNDTSNFLAFLQELRKNPAGAKLVLSAAVGGAPFFDSHGKPSTNVSGFAKVFDYIAVMNYNIWGSWSSKVGPNAPLNDACAAKDNQDGSAVAALKLWTAAGMPANKIVLGVASYGHSFSVLPKDAFVPGSTTQLRPYPTFNASKQPSGDKWNGAGGDWDFWGLIDGGFLTPQGMPAKGIYHRYDACSQTPYVYNKKTEVMVSFDNAQSFAAKGNYIKKAGLRGFAMWEAGGDRKDILLNSIRSTSGVHK